MPGCRYIGVSDRRSRRDRLHATHARSDAAANAVLHLPVERLPRRVAKVERPAIDRSKIQDQLDRLNDLYIMGKIGREEYVGRSRALDQQLAGGLPQPTYSEAVFTGLRMHSATWPACGAGLARPAS